METFVRDMFGQGALLCLMPCGLFIAGTLIIMLWSLIAGMFGRDSYHTTVRQTFWRLMRKFVKML